MKRFALVPACLVALGVSLPVAAQTAVLRESAGARLGDLDQMELTPFPASNWSLLSDWANGEALPSAATDGNVVLIVTWANWNPASMRVLPMVQRLAADNEGKGLVVVGVHHNDGWEGGADAASKAGVKFRYARDVNNAFRGALKVDNDPDFYLIDRAGQLRYADIQTQSVASAVNELVAESREAAADLPALLKKREAERAAEAKRTGVIRQDFDLAKLPEMDIPKIPAEAYAKVEWPKRYKEFETNQLRISQYNYGGAAEDIKVLEEPKGGVNGSRWFDVPPVLTGRAIVVYFWSPGVPESFRGAQPMLDSLQRAKGRDIAVVGVMVPKAPDTTGYSTPTAEENEKARQKFLDQAEAARTRQRYNHAIFVDPDRTVLEFLVGKNYSTQGELPYPIAAIFSSDKTLRWIGQPTDSRFTTALEQILRVDPGVLARREAEAKYIREHGQ